MASWVNEEHPEGVVGGAAAEVDQQKVERAGKEVVGGAA